MKYKKKKATTMLELIIYLGIGLIIITITLEMIIYSNKIFVDVKDESIILNEVEECFINLDNIVKKASVEELYVKENTLYIKIPKEKKLKGICFKGNKINVYCYKIDDNSLLSVNVLIRDIEEFNIYKKNKLIYISIKKEGRSYTKCL